MLHTLRIALSILVCLIGLVTAVGATTLFLFDPGAGPIAQFLLATVIYTGGVLIRRVDRMDAITVPLLLRSWLINAVVLAVSVALVILILRLVAVGGAAG